MDLENLSKQGLMSAADNMRRAVEDIDGTFGKGYAKAHPELVGALVMAAAIDYSGTVLYNVKEETNNTLSSVSEEISAALRMISGKEG